MNEALERAGTPLSEPGDAVVAAYERLRAQIVHPGREVRGELGLTLLLCQGMAAWVDAWLSCARQERSSETQPGMSGGATRQPSGFDNEVVMLLAGSLYLGFAFISILAMLLLFHNLRGPARSF